MALGLGRMMGFRFPENFNRPYSARSVTDFWRRWHISLSNWMRLYLYIPLGGNRGTPVRTYLNLWVVFLISGLWHGADWTFVAWGAYYGFFLCVEKLCEQRPQYAIRMSPLMKHALTLLIVMVGWVFFRSNSIGQAFHYIGSMFFLHESAAVDAPPWGLVFGNRDLVTMAIGIVLSCATLQGLRPPRGLGSAWNASMTVAGVQPMLVQFCATLTLLVVATASIVSSGYAPFLYFRF